MEVSKADILEMKKLVEGAKEDYYKAIRILGENIPVEAKNELASLSFCLLKLEAIIKEYDEAI